MIELEHVVKTYRVPVREEGMAGALRSLVRRRSREVRAVDDLSFTIAAGERVGFLGPNGAGKTTTLKMLSGLLFPTAGRIDVAGFVPSKRQAAFLRTITYVAGQKERLIWDLPPLDTFEYQRAIYRIPADRYRATLDELVQLLEISDVIGKPARRLSLGERMKCELAAALLHRPQVLFLDEPTIGLDVHMQYVIREMIAAYNVRYGATVVLTSHDLRDVEALCPRIILIDQGKILYDGELAGFARLHHTEKRITVHWLAQEPPAMLAEMPGRVERQSGSETVYGVASADVPEVVQSLNATGAVRDLRVEDPPLERIFVDLYRRRAAEREAAASV